MIRPTQRRLTILFTTVIVVFHIIIYAIGFVYLNQSLLQSLKNHLDKDIEGEFVQYLRKFSLAELERYYEDEYLQVFDKSGRLLGGTHGHRAMGLDINRELFDKAVAGARSHEMITYEGNRFLVAYAPIDDFIIRAAMPLTTVVDYERNFLMLVLFTLPVTLILSFVVSRYLVHLAMKPIADVFTFQENFSSNVTHELRTPLASLKGNLEVALRKERNSEEYRAALMVGLQEVDRIIGLLNNLHLLASSKFRPLDLLRESADLKLVLEGLVRQYEAVITRKGITIDRSGLKEVYCSCDNTLMRRAIENIFDNAVKYTPDGGLIRLSTIDEERRVVLRIENTCLAQVRQEAANYFEPFVRGEQGRSNDIEGKGLGLYIARYIIRSHGGTISLNVSDDGMCLVEVTHPKPQYVN